MPCLSWVPSSQHCVLSLAAAGPHPPDCTAALTWAAIASMAQRPGGMPPALLRLVAPIRCGWLGWPWVVSGPYCFISSMDTYLCGRCTAGRCWAYGIVTVHAPCHTLSCLPNIEDTAPDGGTWLDLAATCREHIGASLTCRLTLSCRAAVLSQGSPGCGGASGPRRVWFCGAGAQHPGPAVDRGQTGPFHQQCTALGAAAAAGGRAPAAAEGGEAAALLTLKLSYSSGCSVVLLRL